jgi:hypothetical protein
MSASSPQRRVRQKIEENVAASRAKIMNRAVIPEGNVVRADIMVAPLDDIHQIIQNLSLGLPPQLRLHCAHQTGSRILCSS